MQGRRKLRPGQRQKVRAVAEVLGSQPFDWEEVGWIGNSHFLSGGTVSPPTLRAQALVSASVALLTDLHARGWTLERHDCKEDD